MFTIVITEKGGAQRRAEFSKSEVTIGRVQGNDIILPKGNVSKRHSRIVFKDGRFVVVDLKSTNGTYVNGRKITSPLVVKAGDKIYIGDFILTIDEAVGGAYPVEMPDPYSQGIVSPGSHAPSSRSQSAIPISAPLREPEPIPPPAASPTYPPPPSERPMAGASSHPPSTAQGDAGMGRPRHTTHPPPSLVPPVSHPVPSSPVGFKTGLRLLMGRVGTELDIHNADPRAMQDQNRWSLARSLIERMAGAMQREGVLQEAVSPQTLTELALRESVGLGPLESLLSDETVREIIVEGPTRILADFGRGLERVDGSFSSNGALLTAVSRLAAQAGEALDPSRPISEVTLPYGPHMTVVLPPVAVRGPLIELRRVSRTLSAEELVSRKSMTQEMFDLLEDTVEAERNILVIGPVGSGVTTLLGILTELTESSQRIVTVQAVSDMPVRREQVIALSTGTASHSISMRQVLAQASRLRADRLVIDDVSGPEVLDALTALAARTPGNFLGVHAPDHVEPIDQLGLLVRLERELPERVLDELIVQAVHLIVRLTKSKDGRRVARMSEVIGIADGQVRTRDIFTYDRDFHATGYRPTFLEP